MVLGSHPTTNICEKISYTFKGNLEAVVALAIFASIATLLLGQIQKNRQEEAKILQKEEVLRVAKMALQTGQNQININGVEIQVFSSEKGLEVYHGSEQLLAIKEP
ncbi:type II secretory pathway%2C pseudopilin PulG [Streptococcus pneumoniae]|nr:type II secretory pathway%2C pseudopilin PulG [Streptococcus pneumoniae]